MNNTMFNLKDFLESEVQNATFHNENMLVTVFKTPAPDYAGELTLIYMLSLWETQQLPSSASVAGIWQPEANTLWHANWDMRKLYEAMPIADREAMSLGDMHDRLSNIKKTATTMLWQEAERGHFPVTDEAERCYCSVQEFIDNYAQRAVVDHFMKRTMPTFNHVVPLDYDALNWKELLTAIVAPSWLAKEKMEAYARLSACRLNLTIDTLPYVTAEVKRMESIPSMVLRRKIAECVDPDAMNTVRVFIERDGVCLDSKVETRSIRAFFGCEKLFSLNLDKKPRDWWRKHFGYEDIRPEDIVSITYGRNTLYAKEDK